MDLKFSDIKILGTYGLSMVIEHNKEIYCAIHDKFLASFNDIISIDSPFIQKPLHKTDMVLSDGFNNIFKLERIDYLVKIQSLPITYIKEMLMQLCDLNTKLVSNGYVAYDINEGNVYNTIYGTKWLDFDGIRPLDYMVNKDRPSIYGYILWCYLVHKYLYKNFNGVHTEFTGETLKYYGGRLVDALSLDFDLPESWSIIKSIISEYPVSISESFWADQYALTMDRDVYKNDAKVNNFQALIKSINFNTAVDIGNKGFFTGIIAENARSVVGIDCDEPCIDKAITYNNDYTKLPICFAVANLSAVMNDTHGKLGRFKSDLSCSLAITHHLNLQGINPASYSRFLDKISNKYIILEDVPHNGVDLTEAYQVELDKMGWTLQQRLPSSPSPRTLALYVRR